MVNLRRFGDRTRVRLGAFGTARPLPRRSGVMTGAKWAARAATLGLLLASADPARAQSAPEEPPPLAEPHVVHRPRPAFLTAGGITFGISYGTAVLLGL